MSDNQQPLNAVDKRKRAIRSFVLRGGRMTVGQQKAYEKNWPKFGLHKEEGLLDPQSVFARTAPLTLEIGFGMGQSLAQMALREPGRDFIGVEVHKPGVGALLKAIEADKLDNVRVYCDDAVAVLDNCIPDDSLDRVQLYFPDPWHKKKHHKRRIVQLEFVQKIRTKLAVAGVFHLATDWQNYAEHMLEVMEAAQGFANCAGAGAWSPRPEFRPLTKFERRGMRLGHGVWDLLYKKIP